MSEEVKRVYRGKLGEREGLYFYHLWTLWGHTLFSFNEFEALFSNPRHVELMNRLAGSFFAHIQRLALDDILLQLCKMTDKGEMSGRKNVTIMGLDAIVPSEQELKDEITRTSGHALKATEFARTHRNKRIAHRDFGRFGNEAVTPLTRGYQTENQDGAQ